VTAIVLANLCVSYIMMGENPIAEELMKRIEAAEREVPVRPGPRPLSVGVG
jgi:tetratricopeptide repeat protein 30